MQENKWGQDLSKSGLDVSVCVVEFQVGLIFGRDDAGAQLIDVTVIFAEEVDKSADSRTVGVADTFGEALIGSGEDCCCVSGRDSMPTDGWC